MLGRTPSPLIQANDLGHDLACTGPGHGAPGVLGPTYLDGSYSEIYRDTSRTRKGCAAFSSSSPSPATSAATAPAKRRLDP